MALDKNNLERVFREWIKDSLAPLLREGSLFGDSMAQQMVHELEELSRFDEAGTPYAPDQFTLSIHPEAAIGLAGSLTDVHGAVSQSLEKTLVSHGFKLSRRLHVTLATDPTLHVVEATVIAWHSGDPLKITRELSPEKLADAGKPPVGAFLVVSGRRQFPLDQPEIRIGRLLENDLVLNDPHISRRHALLRLEDGRYVLYDLRSTAGTRVNGEPIRSQPLRPGDVIMLASQEMIYGERPGRPPSEVQPYAPPSAVHDLEREVTPLDLKRLDFPTRTFRREPGRPDPDGADDLPG
jgi:hypothetical protein